MTIAVEISARTLRERIAGALLKRYQVSARAGMHPSQLSSLLSERVPLRPDVAERIDAAIQDLSGAGPEGAP